MSLTNEQRLNIAWRHYVTSGSGPHPGGMPAQPSKMHSFVAEDGIVFLRNSFETLAKLHVDDNGNLEELPFDPYESASA